MPPTWSTWKKKFSEACECRPTQRLNSTGALSVITHKTMLSHGICEYWGKCVQREDWCNIIFGRYNLSVILVTPDCTLSLLWWINTRWLTATVMTKKRMLSLACRSFIVHCFIQIFFCEDIVDYLIKLYAPISLDSVHSFFAMLSCTKGLYGYITLGWWPWSMP